MRGKHSTRRGFTLVETVIALAVIMAISIAGLHLTVTGAKAEAQNETRFLAARLAEDSYACFRFAQDEETMLTALKMLDAQFQHQPGTKLYALDKETCVIQITADFSDGDFSYRALKPNGNVIFTWGSGV